MFVTWIWLVCFAGDSVWTFGALYLVDDVGISGESVEDLSQRRDIKEPEKKKIPSHLQRSRSALTFQGCYLMGA